ncbi:hypothetical protein K440DRAFT_658434 [Wilcoxina mikolae CBS 423.85]|nr:hypothetical protein K440DRAFT_658434 [Wilcoxina mikolae CBS 423.85]
MPILSALTSAASWHIISYGTLLGSQFFQSFVGGIVAFRALPRPQFSQLQQKIFPIYFSMQTALPLIVLLTHPTAPYSELLSTETAAPMLATFLTSAANLGIVGPATTSVMRERKRQETIEGNKYYDEGEKSEAMTELNRRFAKLHGASSVLNLVGFVSTVVYGFALGGHLKM